MRVLWLSHLVPWPPRGGVLQRSHHLLREAGGRHELHLVALNQRAILPGEAELAEAVRVLSACCARVDVFPIESDASRGHWLAMLAAGLLRKTPYDVNWLESATLGDFVRRLAREAAFDLIHVDTLGMIPYTRAFRGVPRVLNHHNVESHMMARRAEKAGWSRPYLSYEARKLADYEREVCPQVARNIVVSPLDGERLVSVVGDVPWSVVDNGVDVEFFRTRPGARPVPRRLIFAGGMSWYPNREAVRVLADEIWPRLQQTEAGWSLDVVGADPPRELQRAAARDKSLTVPGFVDDVRPRIEEAAIYVCPIRDGGGTRLKILDALAMARPLVATELAAEGLGLVDGEHYLRAETPDEFVAALQRLDADPDLARRLAAAGRRHVETGYAWPVVGEKLEAAWQQARAGD